MATAAGSSSIHVYANPQVFLRIANAVIPVAWVVAIVCITLGLYWGLVTSPQDYQQGQSVRIMYVHVPAAWMALFCYTAMAAASLMSFIFRHPLADVAAKALAPIGAVFAFVCLVTGALWGKPTWGTYWVWDARLTSMLILFFLYLGYIAVWHAFDDLTRAGRVAGIVAMVGVINVPIIKFSVDWWNSLHQPASITRFDTPAIDPAMLWPLLTMALGFMALTLALHGLRMKTELYERRVARLSREAPAPARAIIEEGA